MANNINTVGLEAFVKAFSTGIKYSYKKRKEIYLKHLEDKYGKDRSRS